MSAEHGGPGPDDTTPETGATPEAPVEAPVNKDAADIAALQNFYGELKSKEAVSDNIEKHLEKGDLLRGPDNALFPTRFDRDGRLLSPNQQAWSKEIINSAQEAYARNKAPMKERNLEAELFEEDLFRRLSVAKTPEEVAAIAASLQEREEEVKIPDRSGKTTRKEKAIVPGVIEEDTQDDQELRHFGATDKERSKSWIASKLVNQFMQHTAKLVWAEAQAAANPTVEADPAAAVTPPEALPSSAEAREQRRDAVVAEFLRTRAEHKLGVELSPEEKKGRAEKLTAARELLTNARGAELQTKRVETAALLEDQMAKLAEFRKPDFRGVYRLNANAENPSDSAETMAAILTNLHPESNYFEERKEPGKGHNIVGRAFKTNDPNVVVIQRWDLDKQQFLGVVAIKGGEPLVQADTKSDKLTTRFRANARMISHVLRSKPGMAAERERMSAETWQSAEAKPAAEVPVVPVAPELPRRDDSSPVSAEDAVVKRYQSMLDVMDRLGYSDEAIIKTKTTAKVKPFWDQMTTNLFAERVKRKQPKYEQLVFPVETK